MWWGTLMLACSGPVSFEGGTLEAVSANDGTVRMAVDLDDATSVLFALEADGLLGVDTLEGPDGVVLDWEGWQGNEQLTTAVFTSERQTVLNWPVRAQDGRLPDGEWVLTASVVDEALQPRSGVEVRALFQEKGDPDLESGTVEVLLLVPDALDAGLAAGAVAASERWTEVWGRYGIDLRIDVQTADLDIVVPDLFRGDPRVLDAVALRDDHALVAWVGEELEGLPSALGNAGSVPNASFDGPRALMGLAALGAAGTDGVLSTEETRLFGDVMAHEAAHFLGLFHPFEINGSKTDALSDTPFCSGTADCEATLAGNLMFPYALCGGGDCTDADQLTTDQQAVLHRYVGVR